MVRKSSSGPYSFGFYDMFCGIGAFHLAATQLGGECTGACDNDTFVKQTYKKWYEVDPEDDVRAIEALPRNTDWLFAGFPCPTFSLAGKSKLRSLGRKDGLEEWKRGQLIFEISRIVKDSTRRPRVIILENVKHLVGHGGGRTFEIILNEFAGLGYDTRHWKILNSLDFGCPQNRERVFVVLFLGEAPEGYEIPTGSNAASRPLRDYLENEVDPKYTLGPGTWSTLERHKRHHESRGNGFGFRLLDTSNDDVVCPTISARYHKDGAEALIPVPGQSTPRRLTPPEIARIFGFPDHLEFDVSDTQAYRQLGNSIVVGVAEAVVASVVAALSTKEERLRTASSPGSSVGASVGRGASG